MDAEASKSVQLWPITIMTSVLLFGLSYAIISLDIKGVQLNWEKRRCEPAVMLAGWMYKPDGDGRSATEFAVENFSFCVNGLIDRIFTSLLTPVMTAMKGNLAATDQVQKSVNTLKGSAQFMTNGVIQIIQPMYNQFRTIIELIKNSFVRFKMAWERMSGIFTAITFAGLSGIKALENAKDFIIKVCIIILSILVAIFILLFFVLFPYTPIIITTISIIAATAAGGAVSGMSGTFCVPPGTLVNCGIKGWLPVETLVLGQELEGGATVEGIVCANGLHSPMVSIDDIIVSAGHLVWNSESKKWCSADEHPRANPIATRYHTVYCLNTTSHTWRISTCSSHPGTELVLRDWEELPSCFDTSTVWDTKIALELDTRSTLQKAVRGLFGLNTLLLTRTRGVQPISAITLGEEVRDYRDDTFTWTTVQAIIRDISESVPPQGPNEGCWKYSEVRDSWEHIDLTDGCDAVSEGYSIITTSGTFFCEEHGLFRDFTEIGLEKLDTLRPWILEKLNCSSLE